MQNEWRNKWALVTGASAGIGVALATELAAGGTHLILTARRQDRLEALAQALTKTHAIEAEIFVADLAERESPEKIFAFTKQKGLVTELPLINNAGFGQYGELPEVGTERLLDMVQVNCSAVVHLTRLFLPDMVSRGRGDILILSSTAAFQAVPYISTYAATKAFDLLFAEGLAEEMKPHGIRVCALCPGSTESEFHAVAGQEQFTRAKQETAEKVARTGLQALAAGQSYVISGLGNYLGVHSQRIVPRRAVTRIAASMFRPGTKH
jgi:short-subunit dehydrogenase